MYLAIPTAEVQDQDETILEAGLRAFARMTKEEFEGLILILQILLAKGAQAE